MQMANLEIHPFYLRKFINQKAVTGIGTALRKYR